MQCLIVCWNVSLIKRIIPLTWIWDAKDSSGRTDTPTFVICVFKLWLRVFSFDEGTNAINAWQCHLCCFGVFEWESGGVLIFPLSFVCLPSVQTEQKIAYFVMVRSNTMVQKVLSCEVKNWIWSSGVSNRKHFRHTKGQCGSAGVQKNFPARRARDIVSHILKQEWLWLLWAN